MSTESLQCYKCPLLHSGESCNQTQSCYHSHNFCITLVSHGNTGEHLERHTQGGGPEKKPTLTPMPCPYHLFSTPPRQGSPDHLFHVVYQDLQTLHHDGVRHPDDQDLLPVQTVQYSTLAEPPSPGLSGWLGRQPCG